VSYYVSATLATTHDSTTCSLHTTSSKLVTTSVLCFRVLFNSLLNIRLSFFCKSPSVVSGYYCSTQTPSPYTLRHQRKYRWCAGRSVKYVHLRTCRVGHQPRSGGGQIHWPPIANSIFLFEIGCTYHYILSV